MQLDELLEGYRSAATNEREKGDYFERLVRVFLEHDDIQKQYYSAVVPFSEWAKEQGWSNADTGIDLVATLADGSGYAAIQCKFYVPTHVIQKPDIDSFISAASSDLFTRLIIADTTQRDFGRNTKETLNNLSKDWNRIGINELAASRIDWSQFLRTGNISLAPKKELKDHQREALKAVTEGLEEADRGKMIMACGTGKTFTGLRIAETIGGPGKRVLFMVPSLALMSQTVREWKNDAQDDFTAFSACSDVRVGRRADADSLDLNIHDLAFPATTDPAKLAQQVADADPDQMTVVFSTYHSIDVLTRAQQNHGLPEFDLVICDEAHRTTGVTLKDEDDSNFVRIHSNDYVTADMVANLLPDNSERRTRQKALDIRVIIGNPPYSAGQKSANDDAANIYYPQLDDRIRNTYVAQSSVVNKKSIYDSYIRAFRWAGDRIGDAGIMAFVSGSAWIERSFADGMRKCLAEEFSDLYVLHLRGDIRKNMLSKGAAREGQNVFGSGSMTGISISILVKNPRTKENGRIHFHDIGPDLTTTQKLNTVRDLTSVGIPQF